MRPVKPRAPRRDPAPSRIRYRLSRLWLRTWVKQGLTLWLPLVASFVGIVLLISHPTNQARMDELVGTIRSTAFARPEFTISRLITTGASEELRQQAEAVIAVSLPVSSMELDLQAIRARVEALPAIRRAQVKVQHGDSLIVRLEERVPVAVYRSGNGLMLLDREGYFVRSVKKRKARPDLPLIAGAGADRAVDEALRLYAVAAPIRARVRGLVRVGERRWTLVLDRDQEVYLPASESEAALRRVIALDAADELLDRDISVVDMRDRGRLVVRLSRTAQETLKLLREEVDGEDT